MVIGHNIVSECSVNYVAFRTSTLRLYATGVYVCALSVLDSTALASHVPRRWLNALFAEVCLAFLRSVVRLSAGCRLSVTFMSSTQTVKRIWMPHDRYT